MVAISKQTDITGKANTALDNLASVAINLSLISDTNLTDNLGSSSISWNIGYINRIQFDSTDYLEGQGNTIYGETKLFELDNLSTSIIDFIVVSSGSDANKRSAGFSLDANVVGTNPRGTLVISTGSIIGGGFAGGGDIILAPANTETFRVTTTSLNPTTDSLRDLGTSTIFWDETYTDEIVLSNVGAATAAADTIRLAAYDVSAGNTSLDIQIEGTGAVLTGQADSASSVRVKVKINGTEYQLLAV